MTLITKGMGIIMKKGGGDLLKNLKNFQAKALKNN